MRETLKNELEMTKIVEKNPSNVEEGLKVLKILFKLPNKKEIDVLAVDKYNVLTVIELKVGSDEGQLNQAMGYYNWALENLDTIKKIYKDTTIEERNPRLILIAESYSDELLNLAKYLNETINLKLYRYTCVKCDNKKMLVCAEEEIPDIPGIFTPTTASGSLANIKNKEVNSRTKALIKYLQSLDEEVTIEPKAWGGFSIKYSGRRFCWIDLKREFINSGFKKNQKKDEWEYIDRANTLSDFKKMKKLARSAFDEVKEYMEPD